ncbi:unnamed protein product [Rhodiola kirilowii]
MMGSISSEDQEAHPSSSSSSDLAHHHFLQLTLPQLLPPPPPLSLSLSSASSSTSFSSPSFQCQTFNSVTATTPQMRQLLIKCAELTSQSDFSAAHRLLVLLLERSSPDGDSVERLVHHFAKAISYRLNNIINPSVNNFIPFIFSSPSSTISTSNLNQQPCSDALHHSTFLTLNKITPFIRFIHLTANQAILEAVDGESDIHILDFDIMQGFQWPPFMQALAERFSSSDHHHHHHPPMLRITGTGHDMDVLMRTGDRLLKFAQSLNLRFQFNPLLLHHTTDLISSLFTPLLHQHETLAVNCILHLHKFTDETLYKLLSTIKSFNPRIVTFAEREANHKTPIFLHRFVEALDHYSAIFNSLEANLPPSSQERLAVEQVWFGSEILDIVGMQGANRREMHRRFESWEVMLRSSGFSKVPLSSFAFSQAKLLLRLHYPSEGYKIQNFSDCFFLSWKNRLLFSISSWH